MCLARPEGTTEGNVKWVSLSTSGARWEPVSTNFRYPQCKAYTVNEEPRGGTQRLVIR